MTEQDETAIDRFQPIQTILAVAASILAAYFVYQYPGGLIEPYVEIAAVVAFVVSLVVYIDVFHWLSGYRLPSGVLHDGE